MIYKFEGVEGTHFWAYLWDTGLEQCHFRAQVTNETANQDKGKSSSLCRESSANQASCEHWKKVLLALERHFLIQT